MFRRKVTLQELERICEELAVAETALRNAQSDYLTSSVSRRLSRIADRVHLDRVNVRDEIAWRTPSWL
ncbi:hypothetical protein BCL93_105122 [Onishia taeanensis]|uniref:Uncharacterized protein n=1 Tax=Onishia taeanensis TaxID=284577 RepID=A0A328Y009_9GAMM|nr:hypothetical protein [Halomonas taeanensis]RAR61521.1 hypothetical protein BCL93_105122 [Halomonas taeanensis]